MSVGERLRRARLERGLSLEQVSRDTKVQCWILDAIERDDVARVPGGVFIRGYLTSFARATGLDPGEILTAYLGENPAPIPTPPVPVEEPPPRTGTSLWQMAVIAAAVVAVAVIWRNAARSHSDVAVVAPAKVAVTAPKPAQPTEPPSQALAPNPAQQQESVTATVAPQQESVPPATASSKPVQPQEPAPEATAGSTAATTPIDSERAQAAVPLVVELHTTREAWIDASADGERKAYRLFMPGEDLRLEGVKQIRLLVGDAAAVSYTINGKSGRPLGDAGVVREIIIEPDNYQSFVGQ